MLRIAQMGVGPIGAAIAARVRRHPGMTLVGAADPALAGRPLDELLGVTGGGGLAVAPSIDDLLRRTPAEVVVHCAGSYLDVVADQLSPLLRGGVSVVSTCEELAYPVPLHPDAARRLDEDARAGSAVLLGTGVNPGFVMDKLVVTLMSACDEVRAVHVTRLVDAATRRVPFQRKVGAGLTREAFEERLRQGRFGHVGLPETAHMLADAMGLPPAREVRTTIGPVIAERAHESGAIPVQPGQVAGLEQSLVLEAAGVQRVRLEMRMAVGEPEPRDAVVIDGSPPLAMTVSTGVAGDEGTAAVVLACLPLVGALEPGLRTMLDVPIRPPWRG